MVESAHYAPTDTYPTKRLCFLSSLPSAHATWIAELQYPPRLATLYALRYMKLQEKAPKFLKKAPRFLKKSLTFSLEPQSFPHRQFRFPIQQPPSSHLRRSSFPRYEGNEDKKQNPIGEGEYNWDETGFSMKVQCDRLEYGNTRTIDRSIVS